MTDDKSRAMMLVTTFGLGRLRPAPGTWGSLPPAVIGVGLVWAGQGPLQCMIAGGSGSVWYIVMAVLIILPSLWCIRYGDMAEAIQGRKDPGFVVADETAGMALTLMCLPHFAMASPMMATISIGLSFLAFRMFDIAKFWPANGFQRYAGGWGILLDDLVAGLQAAGFVWIIAAIARNM